MTTDAIPLVATPREAFVMRWGTASDATREQRRTSYTGRRTNGLMRSLAYLWECPWCASMYVAPAVVYPAWLWTPLGGQHWVVAVLLALAASGLTGLLAQLED